MITGIHSVRATSVALLTLLAATRGPVVFGDDEIHIYTAIEVQFSTAPGKLYQLQGSSNLTSWSDVGDPIFGNGRTISQVYSTKRGSEITFASYRLTTATNPVAGLAPWSFAGVSLSLGDDGPSDHYNFESVTNGIQVSGGISEPFIYSLTRTGDNDVQAEIVRGSTAYYADRREVYSFTFSTANLGTYVREEFRSSTLKSRRLGTFRGLAGLVLPPVVGGSNQPPATTNGVVTVPVTSPGSLAGLEYYFHRGVTPDHLQFTTETNAFEVEGQIRLYYGQVISGERTPVSYTYSLTSSNKAVLSVTYPKSRRDEYLLTFTQGAQGTFIRTEFKGDRVEDADEGSFSPAATPPTSTTGGGPGIPLSIYATNAPAGVVGTKLIIRTGEHPIQLALNTLTAGVETGDGDASSFTYTYLKKSDTTAFLVVSFKADEWNEYDLTYTAAGPGRVTVREFKDNALDRSRTGTFGPSSTP